MFRRIALMWRVTGSLITIMTVMLSAVKIIYQPTHREYNCLYDIDHQTVATYLIDVTSGKAVTFPILPAGMVLTYQEIDRGYDAWNEAWLVTGIVASGGNVVPGSAILVFKDKHSNRRYINVVNRSAIYMRSADSRYIVLGEHNSLGQPIITIRSLPDLTVAVELPSQYMEGSPRGHYFVAISSSFTAALEFGTPSVTNVLIQVIDPERGIKFLIPFELSDYIQTQDLNFAFRWSVDQRYLALYVENFIDVLDMYTGLTTRAADSQQFPTDLAKFAPPVFWSGDQSRLIYLEFDPSIGISLSAYDPLTRHSTPLATEISAFTARSPDSNYVLLTYRRAENKYDTMLLNVITGEEFLFQSNTSEPSIRPLVLWHNNVVINVSTDSIAWMRLDGSGYQQVKSVENYYIVGNHLIYERNFPNREILTAVNLNDATVQVVYEGKPAERTLVSPDLKTLAIFNYDQEVYENTLTLLDLASEKITTHIIGDVIEEQDAQWAPDSTKLALVYALNSTPMITIFSSEGKLLHQLERKAGWRVQPPLWTTCDNVSPNIEQQITNLHP